MEFNATIDLIIKDLNDACQIIDDLKNYPGVPELQVELAKAKCKSAGDVIALLKKIKQQPVAQKIEKVSEPAEKEVPKAETNRPEPVIKIEQPAPPEEKKAPLKQNKTKKTVEEHEVPHTGSFIFADRFINVPASINEQLGTLKSEEDVTEIIKSKPIKSLKTAIGINDRFLFIREIFNGDKETYDQAISRLEDAESIPDAKDVITRYMDINEENEALQQLMDLVKRKLSRNE